MAVEVVEPSVKVKPIYTLDATHRCDCCGAQAYVRVYLKSELDLLFCGHHYTVNQKSLTSILDYLIDERERLIENKLRGSEK